MRKLLLLLLMLPITLCVYAQDTQADIASIKASRESSNAAIARHDADGIAQYWLKDFVQTIGRGQTSTGRDTIMAAWTALFKSNLKVLYVRKPLNIVISDDGKMAWETGMWTAENSYSRGGNYSAMWRKTDGIWKLQAELFVSLQKL